MPPSNFSLMAWFALVPLFGSVMGTRFIFGVLGALLTALTGAVVLATGMLPASHPFAGEVNWVFAGYMLFGLLLLVVAGTVSEMKVIRYRHIPLLAALAVSMESLMMVILPVHLALSQYRNPAALALASIGGIWAVSFLIWATTFLIVKNTSSPRTTMIPTLTWCAVLAIVWNTVALPKAETTSFKVAVVQTQETDLKALSKLTNSAAQKGAQLVVWPELSSISIAPQGNTADLIKLSKEPNEPAIVTSFEDDAKPKPHNVAALYWHGTESARYFKRKPFAGEATLHQRGDKAVVAGWTVPIGLNICFDSCYPAVLRDTVQSADVGLIALPTEDPPSTNGVVQALHSAYTPFRAAELGTSIARADITAYSMIVGSDGRILAELAPGENVLVAKIAPPRDTIYKHLGDWFLYLCWLATGIWIIRRIAKTKRKQNPKVETAQHL
jgi:apolipoprotein N-acyltransferase